MIHWLLYHVLSELFTHRAVQPADLASVAELFDRVSGLGEGRLQWMGELIGRGSLGGR